MKKVIILGLAMALVGGVAYANFCARDAVPAATLLFPYVVVDVDSTGAPDPAGYTTITGIVNVSRPAIIVHFTAWDATSVPRVDFDEILSGYDVLQINWRDFLNGRFDLFDTSATAFTATIPKTFDPFEWGPDGRGQPTTGATLTTPQNRNAITTTQCTTVPPYGNRSDLASTIRSLLNGVLVAYTHDGCAASGRSLRKTAFASDLTAAPIFFYVTADVVLTCNLNFPSDAAYWSGTIAANTNVITGDVIYLKPPSLTAGGYSESFPAVHVEAAASVSRTAVYPFYGEKTTAETRREPLATAFAFRYANDPSGAGVTSNVFLWKNFAEVPAAGHISDCGSYMYYAWDMDERSLSTTTQPISGITTSGLDPNQFPFETQKVPLTTTYFDLPDTYGWMLVILPPSYVFSAGWIDPTDDSATLNTTGTVAVPKFYMGWAATQIIYGAYSTGIEATTMANYMCYTAQVLPQLGTNPGLTIANTYGFITTP